MRGTTVPLENIQLRLVYFIGRSDASSTGCSVRGGHSELWVAGNAGKRVGRIDDGCEGVDPLFEGRLGGCRLRRMKGDTHMSPFFVIVPEH